MVLVVAMLFGIATAGRAADVFMARNEGLLSAEHELFMANLTASFKRLEAPLFHDFSPGQFFTAAVDLNGDGVQEMVVQPMTTYFCGNNPRCPAFVYLKTGSGWVFAGEIYAHTLGDAGWGHAFHVEEAVHLGWRIVRDGGERFCWIDDIKVAEATSGPTPMGMPRHKSRPDAYAGYYLAVPVGKECTDRPPNWFITFR